ncbi:hypothetical protein Tco_0659742 [Tanacetum coccineum]
MPKKNKELEISELSELFKRVRFLRSTRHSAEEFRKGLFVEWCSTLFNAPLAGRVLSFFVLLLGFDLLAAEVPFTSVEGIPGTLVEFIF